jgi:energy-converting hydrogenase Eha subunit C
MTISHIFDSVDLTEAQKQKIDEAFETALQTKLDEKIVELEQHAEDYGQYLVEQTEEANQKYLAEHVHPYFEDIAATAAKEFMAADKTLSKADAIAKAEEEAGIAYKISKGVAGQTGQIGMAEAQTQDAAKEYEAMYGEPMSSERRTGAFLLNLASVNMDAAIGKAILLGKDPLAKVIKDTLVNSDDVVKRTMVQRIALATGLDTARVAGAILEEAGTEATQAGLENVSKYLNF